MPQLWENTLLICTKGSLSGSTPIGQHKAYQPIRTLHEFGALREVLSFGGLYNDNSRWRWLQLFEKWLDTDLVCTASFKNFLLLLRIHESKLVPEKNIDRVTMIFAKRWKSFGVNIYLVRWLLNHGNSLHIFKQTMSSSMLKIKLEIGHFILKPIVLDIKTNSETKTRLSWDVGTFLKVDLFLDILQVCLFGY